MNSDFIFSSFLADNGRLNIKIKHIILYLNSMQNPLHLITSNIKMPAPPIKILKILILIHNIILVCPNILDKQQTICFLSQIQCVKKDAFQKLLKAKAIEPYSLYLQKKLHHQNNKNLSIQERFYFQLNLLQRGLSFSQIIYTFGRYYPDRYPFAIDLNMVIGKDLKAIYERVADLFFQKQSLLQMADEIQKTHEKMYVVYYNCYYHKYMKKYVPKWIRLDQYENLSKSMILESPIKKHNKSVSTVHSSSEKMTQSLFLSNKHEKPDLEESRLDLLNSLKRITAL